jgi:hypothetical protein
MKCTNLQVSVKMLKSSVIVYTDLHVFYLTNTARASCRLACRINVAHSTDRLHMPLNNIGSDKRRQFVSDVSFRKMTWYYMHLVTGKTEGPHG